MKLNYLKQSPNPNYSPPISSNHQELPISSMSWEEFEKLCLRMVQEIENFTIQDSQILGRGGQKQDGIDIYANSVNGKYETYQCKRYKKLSTSNIDKLVAEFKTGKWFIKSNSFTLCTTISFDDIKLQETFEKHRLDLKQLGVNLKIWDSSKINLKLKSHPKIVLDFFGPGWLTVFCGKHVYDKITNSLDIYDLKKCFKKASLFIEQTRNYFENVPSTHIIRKEFKTITKWIEEDLVYPNKNLLVIEGVKGIGKSVVIKDIYNFLINEDYLTLGIKADKYYASTPKELENKIFANEKVTLEKVLKFVNTENIKLVVLIDQIDALSLSLSSNREFLHTYNRLINELLNEKNIRIIISSRSEDLKYDAELSKYKNNDFRNITVSLLSVEDVKKVLLNFDIICTSEKTIELLRVPNHLNIFCKIPKKNELFKADLSSLKELYDELWESLVTKNSQSNLSTLLFQIADKMYLAQRISTFNVFKSRFNDELNYLYSNHLLIEDEEDIQFFHQTFYEYCLSKHFVESDRDICNYIYENSQNLEIRNVLKLVFEYLRQYDHKQYIAITRKILKSSNFRFHIKSLLIINLSHQNKLSADEKLIFKGIILKKPKFMKVFINSIFSKDWINFLLEDNIVFNYFFPEKSFKNRAYEFFKKFHFFSNFLSRDNDFDKKIENDYREALILLLNNINLHPLRILRYIDDLDPFPKKRELMERLIIRINEWDEPEFLKFYDKYFTLDEDGDKFWNYSILEKIFRYDEEFCLSKLRPIFTKNLQDLSGYNNDRVSYEQKEILKNIYELNPNKLFVFLWDLYQKTIQSNRFSFDLNISDKESIYYKCSTFKRSFSSSDGLSRLIEDKIIQYLVENKKSLKSFFNEHKFSDSFDIINILTVVLLKCNAGKDYILELFEIVHSKNGFNSYDDELQLNLRNLITRIFGILNQTEKDRIIRIIRSVSHPYEYRIDEDSFSSVMKFRFKKEYLFICAIPENEIKKIPSLNMRYLELERKFGKLDPKKAMDISTSTSYVVGAPLKSSAYINMSLKNWKKTILKYDDNYIEGHGPRGGKRQHAIQFSEQVSKNPSKFYELILQLTSDKKVAIDYLTSGLEGLIIGGYYPEKVGDLFKKIITKKMDAPNHMYTLKSTDYLISNEVLDNEMFTYIRETALNNPHPIKPLNPNDPLFDSVNTVRGIAIRKIISCYQLTHFKDKIFDTVECAIKDEQDCVKVGIISEISYLNHLDINRSYKIFEDLISQDNPSIMKNSFWSAQYFYWKFHSKMNYYYSRIIENESLHSNGQIIVLAYLNEKTNDINLYKKFINSSSEAKRCALKVAEENLFEDSESIKAKCFNILLSFLKIQDKDIASLYSGIILRKLKPNNFDYFYPFLLKYSSSKICEMEPRYFLEYLLKCVNTNPNECLVLIKKLNFKKTPNIQNRGYYDKEPVQLILKLYSIFNRNFSKNKSQVKQCLNIFDRMLEYNHLRSAAGEAIEILD